MRERHNYVPDNDDEHRITPAYAGKTVTGCSKHSECEDHPRVCGKDACRMPGVVTLGGSPPRMRERQDSQSKREMIYRITPAYAGKT